MCVYNCVQRSSERGLVGGGGVSGEGARGGEEGEGGGRVERKVPDIMKSMVMKINTVTPIIKLM